MIVEQRTYTLKPGSIATYFALYEREGLAVQQEHLGDMFGYYSTDIGHVNSIVHMWRYDSYEDRSARRAALMADPRWNAYLVQMLPLLVDQDAKILIPAPFFTPPPK